MCGLVSTQAVCICGSLYGRAGGQCRGRAGMAWGLCEDQKSDGLSGGAMAGFSGADGPQKDISAWPLSAYGEGIQTVPRSTPRAVG